MLNHERNPDTKIFKGPMVQTDLRVRNKLRAIGGAIRKDSGECGTKCVTLPVALSHCLAKQHGESYVLGWLSDKCSVPANLEGEYRQRNHAMMQCAVADDEYASESVGTESTGSW